jgi:putative transcriptional regulator|nr:MAG TPA: Cro/C1-type HTH DNA-binding domain protein [Caudoviricetes sp.]
MKLNIKNRMEELNITRYELAQKIGVTYPTIDKIYKGESTSIKLDILEALCKELNCNPSEILVSDDPQVNRLLTYTNLVKKLKDNAN